jgi:hypothetical protein
MTAWFAIDRSSQRVRASEKTGSSFSVRVAPRER